MYHHLLRGDITKMEVDAIVNAANSSLLGGGGVDGAIHRAGGPAVLEACRVIRARQGRCRPGQAVITTAGNMPAKFVIHTVGPVWQQGKANEAETLTQCYTNSLRLAEENGCISIAFPNISTGVYGYPKREAAEVALRAVTSYEATTLQAVYMLCWDWRNYNIYEELWSGVVGDRQ